ncbi:RagB/SusD family nutrient uptake outer membrane protein [Pseudotamlana carrageenivorans]|uniref:RagB/SusD family nutrient uptake outer membrane protein n=1 Tax=Pseudotamlana carrageenivorans TaxID=2069432 RepID=A0A2I7SEM1_9FLAO|nr:RagB/SusD family nutrient uptake outer membrane protein [Tamlana carrageenivorans]AUS04345.1 RagB/SusD family nutrient uptake outer membrane protein [Tamlana carrageenivorans]
MKKIILSFSILTMMLTSSCSDYLEESAKHSESPDSFYTSEVGYNSLMAAAYTQLRNIYGQEPYLFCSGTDLYADGKSNGPVGLTSYTALAAGSENIYELYEAGFKAIRVFNTALHYNALTSQTSDIDAKRGEVLFLRALTYFTLVQTYGGVPLIDQYVEVPGFAYSRESAETIYTQILEDLETANTLVPSGSFNGKVTKRAVTHLLSKVHLTRAYEDFAASNDFANAAKYADETIAGESLTIPFDELWDPSNDLNDETIFSVQYDATSIADDPNNNGNQQQNFFGPYMGGAEIAGDFPWRAERLVVTKRAYDLFEQNDARFTATFMPEIYERYYDFYDVADKSQLQVLHYYARTPADTIGYRANNPKVTFHMYPDIFAGNGVNEDFGTIPVKKFDDPTSPFSLGNGTSTRDIVLARLAESYLIAAEAYLNSNPSLGLERLNEVRKRAGVAPATAAEFDIDYILEERGRELMGEYHRWFDLKRTGKLVDYASVYNFQVDAGNFVGKDGVLKILRPIPQEVLDLNQNKDFKQNPAYQ